MAAMSDPELLAVWESARRVHPALRPAQLLRAACGEPSPERLTIGARDRRLLALREAWFGPVCRSVADCPACGVTLEMAFDTRRMIVGTSADGDHFRLPDSRDLLAVADCLDVDEARALLAARCGDGELDAYALSEAMSEADPDGDISLRVTCAACGGGWEVLFDPASVLWRELDAAAMDALRDVDALASAYGWSEREILSMSRERRRAYLDMVTG